MVQNHTNMINIFSDFYLIYQLARISGRKQWDHLWVEPSSYPDDGFVDVSI